MATGLIALLDDVAAIAKVAAATLDDVAAQTIKAGGKAAGIVIDDTAVTPRYVVGFASDRELPIVWKIAMGSLRNKLLILLPAALVLSAFLPWAITPLLMLGGVYLCFEGAEKLLHLFSHHEDEGEAGGVEGEALEDEKVAGAIRTDMILSAEIMALSLASIEAPDFLTRAFILAVVGIVVTMGVYGAVALIVKADDVGAAMARGHFGLTRALGRGLVLGMPPFLQALSLLGTFAMLWVGGGILVHGLAEFGWHGLEHAIHAASEVVAHLVAPLEGFLHWLTGAVLSGILGLGVGAVVVVVLGWARPAH